MLIGSTISGNTAADRSGIYNAVTPSVTVTTTMRDTLVEDACGGSGTIVSEGHNIESPGNTCGFDQPADEVNVRTEDLRLGPLQDNGGPTETHALLPRSVAIDQIPEADCVDADGEPLTTDQRGESRPAGDGCDVGAFEVQP